MPSRSYIAGCGSYLPERCMTNDDLAKIVDTTDDWIVTRTGIHERRIAADGEMTSDLAIAAAKRAIEHADIDKDDIDLVIVATTTPDRTFPATATRVQASLGMKNGAAFDVQAVCSGFLYGLSIADNFVRAEQAKTVLLIGAETFSRILDWTDRSTCVLFGDGAGAVVVKQDPEESGGGGANARGILSTHLHSDGKYADLLYVDGGPSSTKTVGHVRMEGREVFRHAVVNLANVVDEALSANGLERSDIDWLVPHQANLRIIDATANRMNLDSSRVMVNIQRYGNTTNGTIPLCLWEWESRLKKGDNIVLAAFGGGFTWGAIYLKWAYDSAQKDL